MPRTDNLPYAWWETPNIHFCSIKDFRDLCLAVGARMDEAVALNAWGRADAAEDAVEVLEFCRRAGGVFIEPARLRPTPAMMSVWVAQDLRPLDDRAALLPGRQRCVRDGQIV